MKKLEIPKFDEWLYSQKPVREAMGIIIPTPKDCHNPNFQIAGSYCDDLKRKKIKKK
jgi:hypothetical protein